ncbi:MAG: TonB-dependent receptor [Sphingomonadales bacterium]|nr:TonB-dependent receptor [Sphingomonadales bacterium]
MARVGSFQRGRFLVRIVAAIAVVDLAAAPSLAADERVFDVHAGQVGKVLVEFGKQAGWSIGLTDPTLSRHRSVGVKGRHTPVQALRILLRSTGADFTLLDARSARVFAARGPTKPPTRPSSAQENGPSPEILVTASKQETPLARFLGTVTVVDLDSVSPTSSTAEGTAALVARLPMLSSTELGPGRNKIFIRGIADSSFNGASQSTIGHYLGDARLTFNAPNPDLNLYDINRVEVLEGPQGSLYGTGTLGGIIRLVPTAPDTGRITASLTTALSATTKGGLGGDGAAMLNLPLVDDKIAVRAVAYGSVEPGYIDDPVRGKSNVNQTKTNGGRLVLRWQPSPDWTVDGGLVVQDISSADGQYVIAGAPDLTRVTRIAQPFDNDFRLGYVTLTHRAGSLSVTSTTSVVRHDITTVFDATPNDPVAPTSRYDERSDITLIVHETRITGTSGNFDWVAGLSGLYNRNRFSTAIGSQSSESVRNGVENEVEQASAFGQATFCQSCKFEISAGARAEISRSEGSLLERAQGDVSEPSQVDFRLSPSLGIGWNVRHDLMIFGRYEQGSRSGGLAVSPLGDRTTSRRFQDDTLQAIELGFRAGNSETKRAWLNATLSYARWKNIQADLIDSAGLIYTTNLGDGYILGIEAQGGLSPLARVALDGALFLNSSALSDPVPAFNTSRDRDLPDVPATGFRLSAAYSLPVPGGKAINLNASVRYVGPSKLGIGTPFAFSQGRYLTSSVAIIYAVGWGQFSLGIDNVGDVRANRFSYGNPFGFAAGDQRTPLRPRSIRLAVSRSF